MPGDPNAEQLEKLKLFYVNLCVIFVIIMPFVIIAVKLFFPKNGFDEVLDALMAYCLTSMGAIIAHAFPAKQPDWLQALLGRKKADAEVVKIEEKQKT